MKDVAFISNYAKSIISFRGDLIKCISIYSSRIFILAPDYDEHTREQVRSLGAIPVDISLDRLSTNPLKDASDTFKLAHKIKKLNVAVVFCSMAKPVIYGTTAAWMAGVPKRCAMIEGLGYTFIPGASDHWRRRLLRGVMAALYRFSLKRADRVIFLNSDDRDEFISRRIVPLRDYTVLNGIGVDLDAWRGPGPSSNPLIFIMIGRLLREKGVLEYLAASEIIKSETPEARFLLLGDADDNPGSLTRDYIREAVDKAGVEWLGHCDVKPHLARASVFVLPSYREGVPRSTQEAMAFGLPVITTDVPGCRNTVIDGENGFSVPSRDHRALAAAMRRFVDRPELVVTMGARSRALAQERFDVRQKNEILLREMGLR